MGGIRRIIVPVELGYPNNDMNALGPRPLTFSVRFVLSKLPRCPWLAVVPASSRLLNVGVIVTMLCAAAGPACARLCAAEPGPDRQDVAIRH